jgi:hypothetical protein
LKSISLVRLTHCMQRTPVPLLVAYLFAVDGL